MSTTHTHIHTHVNTHFCGCGRTHISAHAHVYPVATVQQTQPTNTEPIAKRTRAKQARITWENTPWGVADRDLADLLEFLHASNDPWERSLIPAVEKDAIERLSLRNKN
jgi:hypothetical protein